MADWRDGLPVFRSATLTLREVEPSAAPSLRDHLSAEEVTRFISTPPDTVAAFERWIGRARTQRSDGTFVCYVIVPAGHAHAVGLIQLWRSSEAADNAEWGLGFLLGKAMCSVDNRRGNRALAKLGAVCTGVALQTHDPDGRPGDFREWEIRPASRP
jgi:hypothetical protein